MFSDDRKLRQRRGGFTLLEALTAAALLLVVAALVVKITGFSHQERRAAARRLWAEQEAANLIERITARPYDQLSAARTSEFGLSDAARQLLPDGELDVAVDEVSGPPRGRRIRVNVRWRNPAGQYDAPVRLTAWVYDRGGQP